MTEYVIGIINRKDMLVEKIFMHFNVKMLHS